MALELNKVTWYSKLLSVIILVGVLPTLSFYLGVKFQETMSSINNYTVQQSEIYPFHAAYPGCIWKKLNSPVVSLMYQKCDTGFNYIDTTVKDNKVILTNTSKDGTTINTAAELELFSKPSSETPEQALKRLVIDRLELPYQREHCVAHKTNTVLFIDHGKEAWIIEPDAEYYKRIQETGEDKIPFRVCGNFGKHIYNASYFEFHDDNPTRFAWVSVGPNDPLFDKESISF